MSFICEYCGEKSEHYNRIKDVHCINGMFMDYAICDKCRKEVQPILDNGTEAFIEHLKETGREIN